MFSYGREVFAVDDEQLVLVELHFLRQVRVEHGDAGAAVVDQQVFEVPEGALQDRHVDVFAVQVGVAVRFVAVAGFEDDVDHVAQRLDQLHERLHHAARG